jgi:hypothetical protein
MTQLTSSRFSGLELTTADGVKDYLIAAAPSASEVINHGEVAFEARSFLYRSTPRGVTMFFARNATQFHDLASGMGFSSQKPVSIHMKANSGSIVSPGTRVVWHHPGIVSIRLNGHRVDSTAKDDGGVETTVPPGTHTVEIVTKP